MSQKRMLSVLMGTHNECKAHVRAAVDSVLEQTYRDFEFLICDDGSDHSFYEWLQRYCKKDTRIRCLRNKKNRGLAYTLNRCLIYAKGSYIVRMDADDLSLPKRFEKQIEFLEEHPEYALVGCNVLLFDNRGVWGKRILEKEPEKSSFLMTSPFVHPAVMIRKDVMDILKGYDMSRGKQRAEDYDLFMRIYVKGFCGYNLQEELLLYREDSNAFRKRKYRYRFYECNVRFHGFCRLGIQKGNFRYVIKPLAVGLVPAGIRRKIRYCQYGGKACEER